MREATEKSIPREILQSQTIAIDSPRRVVKFREFTVESTASEVSNFGGKDSSQEHRKGSKERKKF